MLCIVGPPIWHKDKDFSHTVSWSATYSADLNCEMYSYPKGTVTWYRNDHNGVQITSDGKKVYSDIQFNHYLLVLDKSEV